MNKKIKEGDQIVFGKCKKNKGLDDVTVGKIYTVAGKDEEGLYFIDDAGDKNYSGFDPVLSFGKLTKIVS